MHLAELPSREEMLARLERAALLGRVDDLGDGDDPR
jgi:hypothetical protein